MAPCAPHRRYLEPQWVADGRLYTREFAKGLSPEFGVLVDHGSYHGRRHASRFVSRDRGGGMWQLRRTSTGAVGQS